MPELFWALLIVFGIVGIILIYRINGRSLKQSIIGICAVILSVVFCCVLFISLTTGIGIHRLVPQLILLAVVPMLPFLFIWILPSILNRIFAKHLSHTKVVLADDPSADIAYVKNDAAAESGAEAHIVLSFSVLKKMLLTSRRTKRPFAEVLTEEVQAIKEERAARETRLTEGAQLADEARLTEGTRLSEETKLAEEVRMAEEARIAEEAQLAAEIRIAEETVRAEEARLAEEASTDQQEEMVEEEPMGEETWPAGGPWLSEEERLAEEARLIEELRLAEEERLLEELRLAEEERAAEEARLREELRLAQEERAAEEARLREELRLAEEERAEEERLTGEARLAEEAVSAEAAAKLRVYEKAMEAKSNGGVAIAAALLEKYIADPADERSETDALQTLLSCYISLGRKADAKGLAERLSGRLDEAGVQKMNIIRKLLQ